MDESSICDFSFPALASPDKVLNISDFKGKVVLIVNTASRCGFTAQYQSLEHLWQRYKEKGLVVLGVPCNDFGGQEPEDSEKIKIFCETTYHVTFPMTEKCKIVGDETHPFYRYARAHLGFVASPKWNFHKYLINRKGELVDWFSSVTTPDSQKIIHAIEKHLAFEPLTDT